jgi:hypothetical protein
VIWKKPCVSKGQPETGDFIVPYISRSRPAPVLKRLTLARIVPALALVVAIFTRRQLRST